MRRPVRGEDVRITSGFGVRRHPILLVPKMHTGVDWACAAGTPIMAAGSGVIEEAGRKGEYGNYVRIRHANGYKTAYGHMSRFASGVSEGVKVRQGQIIGYVGQTGMASGPHVHFEVLVNSSYRRPDVDPGTTRTPAGRQTARRLPERTGAHRRPDAPQSRLRQSGHSGRSAVAGCRAFIVAAHRDRLAARLCSSWGRCALVADGGGVYPEASRSGTLGNLHLYVFLIARSGTRMACALEGLTVLDLGTGPAAALATMFLGDHGARVIRLVAPGTPHLREGGFVVWDRGKVCATLDLDAALERLDVLGANQAEMPAGTPLAEFQRLVAGADVLVEDFAPNSPLQRLVEWSRLKRLNPRLVSCSITAYGKRGPWKDDPPIEDLVLARTGLLSGMPGFRPAPVHVVHPLPSVGAALFAANGIAAALLARQTTTGRGRLVETSLMAGAMLYQTKVTGERLERHVFQTHPSGSAPFYSVYPCADGQWVQLGCVHIGFITTAANLLGIGDLIASPVS